MVEFNDGDIGKLVSLELDPETNPIAKALGADKVEVYGRIMELGEDYVSLEVRPIMGVYMLGQKIKQKKIFYSDILDYSF